MKISFLKCCYDWPKPVLLFSAANKDMREEVKSSISHTPDSWNCRISGQIWYQFQAT